MTLHRNDSPNSIILFSKKQSRRAPLKQPRKVGLVDALLGDRAALGRQERQRDGQQIRFAAQAVTEHPVSNQAHQVNLWDKWRSVMSKIYD